MYARLCKAILATIAEYYNTRTILTGLWVVGWPVLNADIALLYQNRIDFHQHSRLLNVGLQCAVCIFSGADYTFGVYGVRAHPVGAAAPTVLTAVGTAYFATFRNDMAKNTGLTVA